MYAKVIVILLVVLASGPVMESSAVQPVPQRQRKLSQLSPKEPPLEKLERDEGYTEEPLDRSVLNFSPAYRGNSIMLLYERLSKIRFQKDEFETTYQYANRIESAVGNNVYAFSLIQGDELSRYDADQQRLEVHIPARYLSGHDELSSAPRDPLRGLSCISVRLNLGFSHYLGKSEAGRSKKVTKLVREDYIIVFDERAGSLQFAIDLPPEIAKNEKNSLILLLVCKLKVPTVSTLWPGQLMVLTETEQIRRPTVSRPSDYVSVKKYVSVELLEVWAYNFITGKVLEKHAVSSAS